MNWSKLFWKGKREQTMRHEIFKVLCSGCGLYIKGCHHPSALHVYYHIHFTSCKSKGRAWAPVCLQWSLLCPQDDHMLVNLAAYMFRLFSTDLFLQCLLSFRQLCPMWLMLCLLNRKYQSLKEEFLWNL